MVVEVHWERNPSKRLEMVAEEEELSVWNMKTMCNTIITKENDNKRAEYH